MAKKDFSSLSPKKSFGTSSNVERYKNLAPKKETLEQKMDNLWVESTAPNVLPTAKKQTIQDTANTYKDILQRNSLISKKPKNTQPVSLNIDIDTKPKDVSELLEVVAPREELMQTLANIKEERRKEEDRWNNLSLGQKIVDPFKTMGQNISYGSLVEDENLAWSEYRSKQDANSKAKAETATKAREQYELSNDRIGKGNAFTKDFAQYLPQMGNQLKYGLGGAAGGAAAGAAGGAGIALAAGQLGPQVIVPEEIATVPAGALTGAIWGGRGGYVAGTAKYGYDAMAGAAYKNLLDMGIPNDIALEISGDEAIVNSLIEGGGSIVDLITLGFGKVAGKGVKTAGKEAAKNTFKNAAKTYGVNLVSEPLEEMAQEKVSIESEKRAAKAAGIKRNVSEYEDKRRILEAGKTAIKIAGITGGGNIAGNVATNQVRKRLVTANEAKTKNNLINSINSLDITQEEKDSFIETLNSVEFNDKVAKEVENIVNTINGAKTEQQTREAQQKQSAEQKVGPKAAGNQPNELQTIEVKETANLRDISSNFEENKPKYNQYRDAEIDEAIVQKAKDTVATKTGKRTKNQWLNVAKNLANDIYTMSDEDVEKYAYKSWIDNKPNNAQNLNKQGQKYVKFSMDEWVNTVYRNVKELRNRTQQTAQQVDTTQIQMPTAKTNAVYNTAKQLNVDTELANRVMDMAKLTEVPVNGFVDVNPKIDGYYKDGAIYINKNSKKAQDRIFVHELTHNIEKADGWQGLRDTIFNSNVLYNELAEKGQTLEEYRQLIKDTYAENEIQLNEDDIDREVIAKFAEQHLLKDQKSIDRMVQENPTFMQRVKNFIDDLVVKFKGTAEEKELLRIQRMYDKAFAESKQTQNNVDKQTEFSISESQEETLKRLNEDWELYNKVREDSYNKRDNVKKQYFEMINSQEYKQALNHIKTLKDTNEIQNSKEYQLIVEADRLNKKAREYQEEIDTAYAEMERISLALAEEEKSHREPSKAIKQAKKSFGTTTNFKEAGYLLQDGSLLDLSGKNQGGTPGRRSIDHREINEVGYDMSEFIDLGNIRLQPESNGFELMHEPTEKQYETLKKYIENANGEVFIDIYKNNKMAQYDSKEYSKNTSATKIISDIQHYFKNGSFPYESDIQKFRYSINTDNQGRQLSKQQQEYFKDSKVRDENGKLKTTYHGTEANVNIPKEYWFTIFDIDKSDNHGNMLGDGFYFTEDKEHAKNYARDKGNIYETYLNITNPLEITEDENGVEMLKMLKEEANKEHLYLRSYLKIKGYDGIHTGKVYVAFDSNQIKNVDNLNPTENEDIRYSVETKGQANAPKKQTVVDNIAPKIEQNIEDLPQETQKVARVLTKAPKKDLDLSFETVSDMLMRKIVDAGNTINTIGKLSNDETLYPMYNNTKQARQSAEYMIGEKQTDITGTKIVGNSLVEIFKPVKAKGEEYTGKFYEYLLHMHNIDRMAQDKPVFGESVTAEISRQKADELLKENPEFEKLANKVYVYNRNLMQWRVDSGLISQEQADIMNKMYPHYVPTFRDMSGTAGSKIVGNAVNIANTVRKATGGNRDILPLDLAMARQTMQTVQAAKRNLFGNRLLNDVLANQEKASKYITAIEKSEDGLDVDEQSDASLSRPDNNTNVFKIYRDGKSFNMYVNSGIFEGLRAISSQVDATDTNKLLNALSKPNTMFKQLVTGMNPVFLIKNPIRDIQDATLYSKNLRKFLNNYPKTFKEQLENSADWQLYKALGGVGSSFFDYETGIDKTLNKSKLQRLSDNTLGRIEELNMMTEQAPRFAEFKATIQRAGNRNYDTLMKAIYNAADVTVNFGRTGTITQVLNKTIVPFLNPSIQGADKLIRTLATTKGGSEWAKLVTKATLFGILPSVLNELIFGDDEEYENLNDRDKDTNFVFKYGDNKWIKIPKGRVISSLGNLANRGIRLVKGQEVNWGDYLSTLADQTAPISPLESNIFSPIKAIKDNKTWYGSDIVPQRLQQYEARNQYDEKTDAFSKWLGGILNYSPKKINYLIDAYTGVIGDFALPLTTPTAEVNPFMKAFTIDGNFSNEIGNKFYETKDKYSKYKNNKPSAVVVSRYLNKQNDMVNDLHAEIRKIQSSDVSDAEKKAKSGELRELINLIESTAIMNVKEYEKAVEKYINKFPNNKERSEDYAYLMANKEMFGAEYAVKAYSTKKYNDNRKKNMNTVFNEIIKNYSKVKTPVAEQKKETLPTASDIPRKIK